MLRDVVILVLSLGFVQCQNVQLCQNCDTTNCPSASLYNTTAEQCLDSLGVNGSMLVSFDQLGTCRLYNDSHCLSQYNASAVDTSIYGTWAARITNTSVCTSVRIRPVKRYIPNTSSANFTNIEWGECAAKCFDREACLSFTYRRLKSSFEDIFRLECDLYDSIENASTYTLTYSRQIWFGDKICSTGCFMEKDGHGFIVNILQSANTYPSLQYLAETGPTDTNQLDEVPIGSVAIFTCRPGYTHLSGTLVRTCLPSLIWSGQRPTCVPVCEVAYPQTCKHCNALASNEPQCSIIDQTLTTSDICRNVTYESRYSVYYNGSACISADCQFVMDGSIAKSVFSSTISCSHQCPSFTFQRYIMTEAVSSADVLFYTVGVDECIRACYDHGLCTAVAFDSWNYTCQLYWNTPFSNVSTIQNSGNILFEVTCLACPYLPPVANATLSYSRLDLEVGTQATYQCTEGLVPREPSVLNCTEHLTWNGTEPNCTLVCEQPPIVSNGTIEPALLNYVPGDTVAFTCHAGYELNGTSQLQCNDTGAWSDPFPTCRTVSCPTINGIQHANVEYYSGNNSAFIKCDYGYILNGSSELLCNSSGTWSPMLPTCNLNATTHPVSTTTTLATSFTTPPPTTSLSPSTTTITTTASSTLTKSTTAITTTASSTPTTSTTAITTTAASTPTTTLSPTTSQSTPTMTITTTASSTHTTTPSLTTSTSTPTTTITTMASSTPTTTPSPITSTSTPTTAITTTASSTHTTTPSLTTSTSTPTTTIKTTASSTPTTTPSPITSTSTQTTATTRTASSSPTMVSSLTTSTTTPTTAKTTTASNTPTSASSLTTSTSTPTTATATMASITPTTALSLTSNSPTSTMITAPTTTTTTTSTTATTISSITTMTSSTLATTTLLPTTTNVHFTTTRPIASRPTPKPLFIMPCICYQEKTFANMSQAQILAHLKKETAIQVNKTARYRGKYESRNDPRPSSKLVGLIGTAIVSSIFGVIALTDVSIVLTHLKAAISNKYKLFHTRKVKPYGR